MRIKIILFGLTLLLSSCFSQRDRRASIDKYSSQIEKNPSGSIDSEVNYTTPLPLPSHTPAAAQHCSFSQDGQSGFEKFSSHLGRFNLCQNTSIDTQVFFQLKSPIYDSRICLVPTFHNSGGYNSIYLGEPKCIFMTDTKVITINFIKNRLSPSGSQIYKNYPITGVIIMKDKPYYFPSPFGMEINSIEAYKRCNQMLDLGNSTYCQAFKALGEYAIINF